MKLLPIIVATLATLSLPGISAIILLQEFDRIGPGGIHVDDQPGGLFWDPVGLGGDYNDIGATWIQSAHGFAAGTRFQPETASFAVFPDNASSAGLLAAVTTAEWHVWEGSSSFVTKPNNPDFIASDVDIVVIPLGLSSGGTDTFRVDADLSLVTFQLEPGKEYVMGIEIQNVSTRLQLSTVAFDGSDDLAVSGDVFGFLQGPDTVFDLTGSQRQFGTALTVSVPEPNTWLLMLAGSALLGFFRNRPN